MSAWSDDRTLQLMHRIVLPVDRALQVADRETGCSSAQLSALGVIIYLKATTLSKLAECERIALPTASRMVDSLVREGLIERVADTQDRRAVRLSATEKGRRVIVEACDRRVEVLREALVDLNEDERAGLSVAIRGLVRIFGYDRPLEDPDPGGKSDKL